MCFGPYNKCMDPILELEDEPTQFLKKLNT